MAKAQTFEELDALSRVRALTEREVRQLERAVRKGVPRHDNWYWNRADDYRLLRHLLRGRKPKQIAILMKRTERSIWQRLTRLGISVTKVEKVVLLVSGPGSGRRANCSIAPDDKKGEG